MANTEIAVGSAVSFIQNISNNPSQPYKLAFSVKSNSADIFTDAKRFSDQLVAEVNQTQGTDTDTTTLNIDEFTRLASGDKIKTYSGISNTGDQSIIRETFKEIGNGKSLITAADFAEYLRVRDIDDGSTDGHAVLNFLI